MKELFVSLVICVAYSGSVSAAEYWNSSQGDNRFINDLNWGGGAGPTSYPAVNMTGADQAMLMAGETESRPIKLWLGNSAGTTGEMTVEGGSLTAAQFLDVGYYGTRTFHLKSGSVRTTTCDIDVAARAGSSGTLNMSGGRAAASIGTPVAQHPQSVAKNSGENRGLIRQNPSKPILSLRQLTNLG